MKKSEELYYLINSLSKSEIRYIKLFLNRKDSILERLFDAIKKQTSYDEKAIKDTFSKEKFINQLTTTKYHLRKLILKALRSYEKEQFEIDELLANVQILFDKGLYSICKAELKRADRLAHEQENFPALIRIQEWERKLHLILHPADHVYIKKCINKQNEYAIRLSNISSLWIENIDVENAPLRYEVDIENYSIKERILVYLINYRKYLYNLDYTMALGTLRSIQSLLLNNPGYLKKDPQLFINNQNNLSAFLIFRNELDESLKETQSTKTYIDKQKKWNAPLIKSLFRTYNTELEIYRMSNQLDKAKSFIEEVITHPSFHQNKMPMDYRLSFYFQFAYIFFLDQDFKSAISWLNKVLDHPQRELRSDIMM
ncbi:MAG: hypothetical protein HKN67_03670, partial [Saprospiraceae bacterium]|nr:hypothetical protein [Saprospiraceae bacterium]